MERLLPSLGQVLGSAFRAEKKDPQTHFDILDVTRGLLEEIIVARDNDEKRRDDDDEVDPFSDDELDDNYLMCCEVCGDEFEAWELVRCEQCDWLMCDGCCSEETDGICKDCERENA